MFKVAKTFIPKDAVTVEILAPTDGATPTGIVITLAGRYTKASKEAQAILADGGARASDETAGLALRKAVAACTIAWEGVEGEDGQPVPCTVENAEALYGHASLEWLWMQMLRAYTDGTRFFERAMGS
jgi:hypothetical protein